MQRRVFFLAAELMTSIAFAVMTPMTIHGQNIGQNFSYASVFDVYLLPNYRVWPPSQQANPILIPLPTVQHQAPLSPSDSVTPPRDAFVPSDVHWPTWEFPLPPRICGEGWTTPGLGLAGDDIPIRVCIL